MLIKNKNIRQMQPCHKQNQNQKEKYEKSQK